MKKLKNNINNIYEEKLREIHDLAGSGKFTMDFIQEKIDTTLGEINTQKDKLDVRLKNFNLYEYSFKIFGISIPIIFLVTSLLPLGFYQNSLAFMLTTGLASTLAYILTGVIVSKNIRHGLFYKLGRVSQDNLKEKRNSLDLYAQALTKESNKNQKRIEEREKLDAELPIEVVENRDYAEKIMQNYYNDTELQELITMIHQDIVNAENLEALKEKIQEIRKNIEIFNKTNSLKEKTTIAEHLEENAYEAEKLYAILADEYENNRVRKLLGDD